jgi:hypothetical protein
MRGEFALNAKVCEPCYENIRLFTPRYATLYTDDGAFRVWSYLPAANEWRTPATDSTPTPAVFFNPEPDRVADLSRQTQKLIVAYLNYDYRNLFESVTRDAVQQEYLDVLLPTRSPADDMRKSYIRELRSDIRTPAIITNKRVYSPDRDPLTKTTTTESTQMTFEQA